MALNNIKAKVFRALGFSGTINDMESAFYKDALNNSKVDVQDTTESTSTSTGAMIVAGGIGCAKTIVSGLGIKLGGVAEANRMDFYETGIFTPILGGNTTAGTYVGIFTGTYTRIGKMVTVSMNIRPSTTATGGTGFLSITALPFDYANGLEVAGSLSFQNLDLTTATPTSVLSVVPVAITGMPNDSITFVELKDNTAWTVTGITGVTTATTMSVQLTYFTA